MSKTKRSNSLNNDGPTAKHSANRLTDAIVHYLTLNGHFVWRQNNGGVYDPTKKIFRRNRNHKKGIPDICGVHKEGVGLYVEVKAGRDKLSEEQIRFGDEVRKRGAYWIVARTLDDVINFL